MFNESNHAHTTGDPKPAWSLSSAGAVGLTLLRAGVGVIMAAHGVQKLQTFEQWHAQVVSLQLPLPDVAAPLAIAGELGGGVGLLLGLLTRVAAFGVISTLAVAIATVHIDHGLFAKNNGFEFPLALLLAALFFLLRGGGPFSVDAVLGRLARADSGGSAHPHASARLDEAFPAHQDGRR